MVENISKSLRWSLKHATRANELTWAFSPLLVFYSYIFTHLRLTGSDVSEFDHVTCVVVLIGPEKTWFFCGSLVSGPWTEPWGSPHESEAVTQWSRSRSWSVTNQRDTSPVGHAFIYACEIGISSDITASSWRVYVCLFVLTGGRTGGACLCVMMSW